MSKSEYCTNLSVKRKQIGLNQRYLPLEEGENTLLFVHIVNLLIYKLYHASANNQEHSFGISVFSFIRLILPDLRLITFPNICRVSSSENCIFITIAWRQSASPWISDRTYWGIAVCSLRLNCTSICACESYTGFSSQCRVDYGCYLQSPYFAVFHYNTHHPQ